MPERAGRNEAIETGQRPILPGSRLERLGEAIPHGLRIGYDVTAAKDRSVWYAPPTGWVTALAGLLARGSVPLRPAFPVSQWPWWTRTRRLQLRG
jgi:hypothetical protein